MMQLYTYFRSSAAFRVRIGLNLKGLDYDMIPVHLTKDGGQQHRPEYLARNPLGLIPLLVDENNGEQTIQQSLAILEYLEETHPTPAILPSQALDRAWVRSLALSIACDIHPIDNLRVLQYLKRNFGISDAQKDEWYAHWIRLGFTGIEQRLSQDRQSEKKVGRFCFGDAPTLADICLVPQVFNAQRGGIQIEEFPEIARIFANCMSLEAFIKATPAQQPDAETP